MKDGHIIEKGNHEELLAAGGFYKNLYESQFDTATVQEEYEIVYNGHI